MLSRVENIERPHQPLAKAIRHGDYGRIQRKQAGFEPIGAFARTPITRQAKTDAAVKAAMPISPRTDERAPREEEKTAAVTKGQKLSFSHTTLFTALANSDDTRKTVGVGEPVVLKANAAGDWTTSGGRFLDPNNTAENTWLAPSRATQNATISLAAHGKTVFETMQVVEPQSVSAKKIFEIDEQLLPIPGVLGVIMQLAIDFGPKDVVFHNVWVREMPCYATNVSGYFATLSPASLIHLPEWEFIKLTETNSLPTLDSAGARRGSKKVGDPPQWPTGHFEWDIPYHFKITKEDGQGKQIPFRVIQAVHVQGFPVPKFTVTKLGQSASRSQPLEPLSFRPLKTDNRKPKNPF